MTLYWNNLQDRKKIAEVLDKNEVVLASSDTVLGLFGALTQQSYDALNTIKKRSGKPYLVTIRSIEMVSKFIDQELDDSLQSVINASWPGPVTLIFKARKDLPDFMKSADGTIALRVPDKQPLIDLLQGYDGLFSTSANIHSEPIPEQVDQINKNIIDQVGAFCLDVADQKLAVLPSTIIDCSSGTFTILRLGSAIKPELEKLLQAAQ